MNMVQTASHALLLGQSYTPLNMPLDIIVPTDTSKTYSFACGMELTSQTTSSGPLRTYFEC
jgi:hypothetical protein